MDNTQYDTHIPILDILRGFAICGIAFANIMYLGAYFFLSPDLQQHYATNPLDQWVLLINDLLFRYKFYTLFSFLFGVGFSILLARAIKKSPKHFVRAYLVRLGFLFIIGWIHSFIFPGDILRIYAIIGIFLLFFKDLSNQKLLFAIGISFFIPIVISIFESIGFYFNPASYFDFPKKEFIGAIQSGSWNDFLAAQFDRTLFYLADNIPARRFFKILGLFLLGLYVGRSKVFYHLDQYIPTIKRVLPWAWLYSLPANILLVEFSPNLDPFVKEVLYALSVYPLTATYVISIIYLCSRCKNNGKIATAFANIGHMSLTCYILENILADIFMLWWGFGLGGKLHVAEYYGVAIFIITLLFIFSKIWFQYFNQGPLEYLMRRGSKFVNTSMNKFN